MKERTKMRSKKEEEGRSPLDNTLPNNLAKTKGITFIPTKRTLKTRSDLHLVSIRLDNTIELEYTRA